MKGWFTNKKKMSYSLGQLAWCVFLAYFTYISHISMLPIEWHHHTIIAASLTVSVWPLQGTFVLWISGHWTSYHLKSFENGKNMNSLPLDFSSHLEESFHHFKGGCGPSFSVFGEARVPKLRGQQWESSRSNKFGKCCWLHLIIGHSQRT